MKKHILIASVLMAAACGSTEYKTPMFFGAFGPMEWPEEHWQGQNYHPLVRDYKNGLPAASRENEALFADVASLSPEDFVGRLKAADILRRVYNEKTGMIDAKETGTVIVDIGPNFYALSRTDQDMIAELLARAYQTDTYIVKDARTQKTVGQITPEGLNLF